MKAAYITQTGPADTIIYGELPMPTIGRKQCLVKVTAVDVNPVDTYIRGGVIAANLPFPFVVGCDLAGTVAEVGPNVKRFQRGDRVWSSNQSFHGRQGTFSEYAAIDEQWLYPTPSSAPDEDVVALSLVALTAHLGLVRDAKLKRREVLFVNGGSGGVGSAVVQIAKILGARVITTAGSDQKAQVCKELGADAVVNYKTGEVDGAIRSFAPEGVNVWWETLREPNFERTIPLLSMRGRMIVMAGRDARPPLPVGPFYVKGCSLHGFAMFNAAARELRAAAEDLNQWIADQKLKARIDRVLPLSQAAEAHRLQEQSTIHKTGELTGKIVLKP